MITYNPVFDLYHSIFRMAHIVVRLEDGEHVEIDKVRIWDYYLLFPSKLHRLSLKRTETDVREARKYWIDTKMNPYDYCGDDRKLFERIKSFQVSALNCLISCGILDKEAYLTGNVCVADRDKLNVFIEHSGELSVREQNALSFLLLLSRNMSLQGADGLKARSHLIESKYDA